MIATAKPDPQKAWDLEDAVHFRQHLHELHSSLTHCEEREAACRSEYASARQATKIARAKLAAAIEEDTKGLPLIDYGRRQSAERGNGHSSRHGLGKIGESDFDCLATTGRKLAAALGCHTGTLQSLVDLAWQVMLPLDEALRKSPT